MIPTEEELKNRFTYHAPTEGQPKKYEIIRNIAYEYADELCSLCPDSRELDEALTHLDAVVFNANAAIARRS